MTGKGSYKIGKIRKDNTQSILRAAEREFAARGFNAASMARIAEGAGLPRTNVHYYFSSKEALYGRVLTDIISLWDASFNQISVDDDPATALAAYIDAKVAYSRSNPLASKIFANEVLQGAPVLSAFLQRDYRQWVSEKAAILRQWAEQGKMDPVDPYHLIFMIWASTQHYADFEVQVRKVLGKTKLSRTDFQAASASLRHIILKGCGLEPPD